MQVSQAFDGYGTETDVLPFGESREGPPSRGLGSGLKVQVWPARVQF